MGEEAVDTGGPSREFWRLLMGEICSKYCHGSEKRTVLDRNVAALQASCFRFQARVGIYVVTTVMLTCSGHSCILYRYGSYLECFVNVCAHCFCRGRSSGWLGCWCQCQQSSWALAYPCFCRPFLITSWGASTYPKTSVMRMCLTNKYRGF